MVTDPGSSPDNPLVLILAALEAGASAPAGSPARAAYDQLARLVGAALDRAGAGQDAEISSAARRVLELAGRGVAPVAPPPPPPLPAAPGWICQVCGLTNR